MVGRSVHCTVGVFSVLHIGIGGVNGTIHSVAADNVAPSGIMPVFGAVVLQSADYIVSRCLGYANSIHLADFQTIGQICPVVSVIGAAIETAVIALKEA